ncbi:hypothetical protein ABEB36_007330 [Hypothenemus hampei]|uniref:Uncharacterized protein n=1 Tax=Hypothenemus hampei TaxID=57062 RepID=A0ABD1ETL3_HYPHA
MNHKLQILNQSLYPQMLYPAQLVWFALNYTNCIRKWHNMMTGGEGVTATGFWFVQTAESCGTNRDVMPPATLSWLPPMDDALADVRCRRRHGHRFLVCSNCRIVWNQP